MLRQIRQQAKEGLLKQGMLRTLLGEKCQAHIGQIRLNGILERLKENKMAKKRKGLWANIHAKRKRIKAGSGETMKRKGAKGAPSNKAFKKAQRTSKKKRR